MKLLVSVFLLLVLSYPATAEVVTSFTTCNNFFFNHQPPNGTLGTQYKMICQKTEDGYEYATLYDTDNKIPVYSAYDFQGIRTKTADWDIEPQLDDQNGGDFMASEGKVNRYLRGKNQALDEDYAGTSNVYDRGHLLPVHHRHSQASPDATFTLTNAAPQHKTFNRGQWKATERVVANMLTINCLNRGFHAYIVTGVVPGNAHIGKQVNVPSHFWSAYCCRDNNDRLQLSGAFYGDNDQTNTVTTTTIAGLDGVLTTLYGLTSFEVFANKCQ
ncbi:endonuclease domain-containing 1 protein-like [Thunnus maccoyii]|uniref:endonuclease domain-containing 1 protein-like n=1 Tax=Thunnus maccoyii TaxID=8240 RepID=UPI001C4B5993|nr:endonuclease domain-containing 1 protein-like [Thunnus maccoyii]